MKDELRPIISVEDSDEDFFSLKEAFKSAGVDNPIERCSHGRHARAALLSQKGCPMSRGAALVLLDLNLPGVHGCDLLLAFRKINPLTPVLVLSTSAHPSDIDRCYRAGANAYLVKPLEFEKWEEMFDRVARFWLDSVALPPVPG